jgi:hypothetical protein
MSYLGPQKAAVSVLIAAYAVPAAIAGAAIFGAYRLGVWERQQRPDFSLDYRGEEGISRHQAGMAWHSIYVKNDKTRLLKDCQLRVDTIADKNRIDQIKFSIFVCPPFDLRPMDDASIIVICVPDGGTNATVNSLYRASQTQWYPLAVRPTLSAENAPYEISFRIFSHDCTPADMRLRASWENNAWQFEKI